MEAGIQRGNGDRPGLRGSTPLAVWRTATSLRKADNDALLWLMETRGTYRAVEEL